MDEVMWAAARMSGVASLVLFTAGLVLGICTRSGRPLPGLPRFSITLVHRNVTLLATVFLVLHVVTLLFDSYAQLKLIDLVVPFLGAYLPFWQGLGTVAFDLILAIVITSLLRRRIGPRTFKAVHWASYAMWPIAMAHALGNGTDAFSIWFMVLAGLCATTVLGAVAWRFLGRFPGERSEKEVVA